MNGYSTSNLSPELQIALAHTPARLRDMLRIFFELDLRLARIVAGTSEPMLGQMRLSWWREMLEKPIAQRPEGDAVLDGIGEHWRGYEPALIELINGWELLLAEELSSAGATEFAKGRAAAFDAIGQMTGISSSDDLIEKAICWALVDCGIHVSNQEERELFLTLAQEHHSGHKLSKPMRG